MNVIVTVLQVIVSILLVIVILLQPKGSGLGSAFGSSYTRTRRGSEKFMFRTTIGLAVLFVIIAIINIFV